MADDLGDKTEDPTPKRRLEARREGNIPRSQELTSAMMLLGGTLLITVLLFPMLGRFRNAMEAVLDGDQVGNPLDPNEARMVVNFIGMTAVRAGLPILLVMAAIAFAVQFSQVGWLFSPKLLKPKLSQLNPLSGVKRLFGLSGMFKAGMSLVKTVVVVLVSVAVMWRERNEIVVLPYLSPLQILSRAAWMVFTLAMWLVAVLLILAVLDLMYQKWKHTHDLKMTKQQVKDELKQSEGDPQVKRRRYRMQQQIAMQRIQAAVPKADVVVTNPEHIAVAIAYDAERMHAPTVVAKGADFVALRIRQLALINAIPIVERPPLARALYGQVAVGQEIPPDFYNTVAEILAYVYQLDGRKAG